MKTRLLAICLFACTAVTVAYYPSLQSTVKPVNPLVTLPAKQAPVQRQHKIEVVFVLDTTGSMGGLIQAAKDKIWSIASSMASAQQAPVIHMGLIAYRDRGDQYITKVVDLSDDLDSTYATLMSFQAAGGGDGPESVNQALYQAVNDISWSSDDSYKVIFLVGDAPPHMDYPDEMQYPQIAALAQQKGIVINTIQCGEMQQTEQPWMHIAQLGNGRYFQVAQAGSAIAVATPFDSKIAALSRQLDGTRLYYGSPEELAKKATKLRATEALHEELTVAAQARRGVFNISSSGKANLVGGKELVDDLAGERVRLADLDEQHLPEPMQSMSEQERVEFVRDNSRKREELTRQIEALAEQRQQFIREKVSESGAKKDSLDEKIYRAVREQAKVKGLAYEDEEARY